MVYFPSLTERYCGHAVLFICESPERNGMSRRVFPIMCFAVAAVTSSASAQHYAMKMRSFTGPDGSVAFACISLPFAGAAAFVPSERYRSGIAVIVVPESSYRAFLSRRYPSVWYGAAAAEVAAGRSFTPASRAFYEATRKEASVPFEAEGSSFGSISSPRLPVAGDHDEASLLQVDAAIGNCRLGQEGRRR